MTRVQADDYGEKRQSILNRASSVFARKGFEVTSMIDIAAACGTSKSHLYHYFRGKEDLLFEIISAHINALSAELTGIVALRISAEERFSRYVNAFVVRAAHSRDENLVLMNDLKFLPPAQRRQVRNMESHLVELMIGLLKDINPTLMLPDKVQAPYAMLLFGMIIWTLTWYRKNGAVTPAELAQRISDLFVQGFKNSQPFVAVDQPTMALS